MPGKPSDKEEEFFARQEFERKKKTEDELHRKMAEEEKLKLKDLHFMKCPKCGMQLIEIPYRELKIDKCSACGGVWLDAGELEAVSKFEEGHRNRFFSVFKK